MSECSTQSNKLELLGKLNASFVHEVRNPLFALSLNLDFLKMNDQELSSESREALNSCLEAVERINTLVDNVLSFSRRNNNTSSYCPINDVVEQALLLTKGYANNKGISIIRELHPDNPSVYFNNNKLLQVILNLLMNAIEACTNQKTVKVRTYTEDESVFMEVEDRGIGIRKEEQEIIFSDFYTGKSEGTGLGLGICRNLVSEYNAELNLESEYNKGSRFYIKFFKASQI